MGEALQPVGGALQAAETRLGEAGATSAQALAKAAGFDGEGARATGFAIQRPDEGKNLVTKYLEFSFWIEILESRPAQLLLVRVKYGISDGFVQQVGLRFFGCVEVVKPLGEEQIGDLFDH